MPAVEERLYLKRSRTGPRQPPVKPAYVKIGKMGVLLPRIIHFFFKNSILNAGS
jgi:hypothetical protein